MTDNDHLDHNRADAPPSAIPEALARLGYPKTAVAIERMRRENRPKTADALTRLAETLAARKADCAPALPLELAAADALEEAESLLLAVEYETASYEVLMGSLERIAAILRGGLGDDAA